MLLRDINHACTYSWGSTCLATLCKEMCKPTNPETKIIGRSSSLLQGWTWYHMPFIAPRLNHKPTYPLLIRWSSGELQHTGTPHGDLIGYRSKLDKMKLEQVRKYFIHLKEILFMFLLL